MTMLFNDTRSSRTTNTASDENTIFLVVSRFDLIPRKAKIAVPAMKANLIEAMA